jgi:hypothetical protein
MITHLILALILTVAGLLAIAGAMFKWNGGKDFEGSHGFVRTLGGIIVRCVCVILGAVLLFGGLYRLQHPVQVSDTRPLSTQELEAFVRTYNLNVVATETIDNRSTVILYRKTNEAGCYEVYTRHKYSGMALDSTKYSGMQYNAPALAFQTFEVKEEHDFVCVLVNSSSLRTKTNQIKVLFRNGQVVSAPWQGQEGAIIQVPIQGELFTEVQFYDKAQREIYRALSGWKAH